MGWRNGQLYLDAHEPLAEEATHRRKKLLALEQALATKAVNGSPAVSGSRALRLADEARGIPVPISPGSPDLDGVLGTAPRVPSEPYWAVADYADP